VSEFRYELTKKTSVDTQEGAGKSGEKVIQASEQFRSHLKRGTKGETV